MASNRGVTCPECGGSTPLPDDLTAPSFACVFCHATLETAAFAGEAAVSADALMEHVRGIAANPEGWQARIAEAPRFHGGSKESRPSRCLHCGADVAVPLKLEVHVLTCQSCGKEQPVDRHISDRERLEIDMARQVAGNEAYKRLLAEGLACPKCGAHNVGFGEGVVQIVCTYCSAAILLSDFVDETAIARHRLKQGMYATRDALRRAEEERLRTTRIVVAVVVVVGLVVAAVAGLLSS